MCVFIGVFFLLSRIARSAPGTTAPSSTVFVGVVYGYLKEDSVFWHIGYVIESLMGYGGL